MIIIEIFYTFINLKPISVSSYRYITFPILICYGCIRIFTIIVTIFQKIII